MRVAIADDSTLFRGGLRLLLSQVGVEVCLEAGDADELMAGIVQARPSFSPAVKELCSPSVL